RCSDRTGCSGDDHGRIVKSPLAHGRFRSLVVHVAGSILLGCEAPDDQPRDAYNLPSFAGEPAGRRSAAPGCVAPGARGFATWLCSVPGHSSFRLRDLGGPAGAIGPAPGRQPLIWTRSKPMPNKPNRGSTRISQPGRKGPAEGRSKARARRTKPGLERLEHRTLLAVDVTAFNVAAGTVTFTGDVGPKKDTLTLSETQVGPDFYLTHGLLANGGSGQYTDNMDVDPGPGYARIKLGTGTAPLITVNLGTNSDTLTLANSWAFRTKIAFDGGAGSDVLQGPSSNLTWNLTGS